MQIFQLDFIRAILEWQIAKNYLQDNEDNFNDKDIKIVSFYEQLNEDEDVDRAVELYGELCNQQNRLGLIGLGVLTTTSSPTIMNVKTNFVCPFEWSINVRVSCVNRDKMLGTLNNVLEALRGKKVDICLLHHVGKHLGDYVIPVGTVTDILHSGDYIGKLEEDSTASVSALITALEEKGVDTTNKDLVYCESTTNKLVAYVYDTENDLWVKNDELVPQHSDFDKLKIDTAFDGLTCDLPTTIGAEEFCNISFNGSSTLVDKNVRLGNDLVRVFVAKDYVIIGENYKFLFRENNNLKYYEVEPLEMPAGNDANGFTSQLRSNGFKTNTQNSSLSIVMNYSFILDLDNKLIKQWFNYCRYGEQNYGENNVITQESMTPNIVYSVKEIWSAFGDYEVHTMKTKIINDMANENSEADVMTLSLSMQVQGDND